MWGNEILTAGDLNAEFNNILNNATSLISPLPGSLDWDGFTHTLDSAGTTLVNSSASIGWNFNTGTKSGTPGSSGHVAEWTANTFTDSATAGSGTATKYVGHKFARPTLAATNASVTTTDAATVYIVNSPLAGSNETITNAWSLWVDDGAVRFDGAVTCNDTIIGTPKGALTPAGHLFGLTLSNNGADATNDIDIAIGECVSDDAAAADRVRMALTSAITKRLDAAWAVGTAQGGLDTGAIANTTYHLWVIARVDTGVVDVLFSTSATSPTMPTNYTKKRRIGSILRESAAIVAFSQDGDEFLRSTAILSYDTTNPGTSAVLATLGVPVGIKVKALCRGQAASTSATPGVVLYTSPDESDQAPSTTAAPLGSGVSFNTSGATWPVPFQLRTNTSAQIRFRLSFSDANVSVRIAPYGWIDARGRMA